MIGLYLLISNVLKKLNTIKFGMSMRIQYRWIDYLQIFNDAKYIYYYEFIDIITREQIIYIESQIINLHIAERNYDFQTEYFFVNDYDSFHQSIIKILNKFKINYIIHTKHDFVRTYYDSKPESFESNLIINNLDQLNKLIKLNNLDQFDFLIKLDRFGQKETFEAFKQIFKLDYYWGMIIAPTGFGKSLMHLLFLCYFLEQNPTLNCILITKKKELLTDINTDIERDLNLLLRSGLIKPIPNIVFCVNDYYNPSKINKLNKQSIIIINIDKLINKQSNILNEELYDPLEKIKLIKWKKIGFLIFDEVHHIGAGCVFELMLYLKNVIKLKYVIGSSATPVRYNQLNQNNIRILFNKLDLENQVKIKELLKEDINILYEITYREAWEAKIILRIKIDLILIDQQLTIIDKTKDHIIGFTYTEDGKQLIKDKIINVLSRSYRKKIILYSANRLSCLEWFESIINDVQFNQYSKHISFSMSDQLVDDEDKSFGAKVIRKKIELNIVNNDLSMGIQNYKSDESFSMLFVVGKATEGFNDKLTDIVFNLDPIINRSIILEMQKMGRTTRIANDKEFGIYVSPIIKTDNYLDDMTDFMSDFIKTISKPINDKDHQPKPQTHTEYDNLYKQIFNINGLVEFDPDTIYDLVFLKSSPNLTYSNCINIIKELENKPMTKKEYYDLCQIDKRLSIEPNILFGAKFDWIEYLSIDRDLYYDIDECKIKIQQLLKTNPILKKHYLNPIVIYNELCKLDNKFPPSDLIIEYYKLKQLNDIIQITHSIKKKGIL